MNRFQWESSKKNNLRFGTKGPMRNSIIILISLTLLIGQWGCTHTIPEKSVVQPGPLADGVRTELRIIGIVSGRYKPECRFSALASGVLTHNSNPMPNFRGVRFTNAHETMIWAQKKKGARYTFNHHSMKALNDDLQMRSDWEIPLATGRQRIKLIGSKAHST